MIHNLQFLQPMNLSLTEEAALSEINYWSINSNKYEIDLINYERLIYFEIYFQNSSQIQDAIQKLKKEIFQNYKNKQQLLFKLTY